MNDQLTLEAAFAEADAAILQAAENADQAWADLAFNLLCDWLRTYPTWFCDDFWSVCPEPREGRALGAVVRKAVAAGLMSKTDVYKPSVRSHGSPKNVWRSEVYSA